MRYWHEAAPAYSEREVVCFVAEKGAWQDALAARRHWTKGLIQQSQ